MAIQDDTEAGPSTPISDRGIQSAHSAANGNIIAKPLHINDGITTCDACRSRKVRCLPLVDAELEQARSDGKASNCRGCFRRNEDCIFEYKYKKPGRPKGAITRNRRASSTQSQPRHDSPVLPSPSLPSRRMIDQSLPPIQTSSDGDTRSHNHAHSAGDQYQRNIQRGSDSALNPQRQPGPPQQVEQRSYLEASSYASASAPEHQYGPATGTIFGSALSVMSQDHSQSYDHMYGMGNGFHSTSGTSLPMLMEDHAPINGITIDLSPNLFSQGNPYPNQITTTASSSSVNGYTDYQRPSPALDHSRDLSPSVPMPKTAEWTLPRSSDSVTASPRTRPFDYPSAAGTPAHHYPSSPPSRPRLNDIQHQQGQGQSSSSSVPTQPQPHPATRHDIPQIDSVVPWHDVCFFISLHMRHQHGLMPLVHKPTFAQDVLQRRDIGDETFRGLLCSIVAYTICQSPINIVTPPYSRQDLEIFLRRCQKTSRAIQLRWHMTPSLESLASLQLDINTALAATQVDLAGALISDARRQVYALNLHTPQPKPGLTCIQLQICRRLFWEIYQSDKTNVMNGISSISLNDLEGVPPLPLEIDDDYITTSVAIVQPEGTVSYMTGFVAVSRIFQILGQCQIRQKTYANNMAAGPPREALLVWVEEQRTGMRRLLDELPGKLRADWREAGGFERAEESSLGIQRANIHITALCVELALLDFRVHLDPEEDTRPERESLARKAYATLSSVPIEYLASNGESMRGKVLRIVLDLLSMTKGGDTGANSSSNSPAQANGGGSSGTGESQAFGKDVWDWWNMYSSVQFFQVIPEVSTADEMAGSRRQSPGR